MGQLGPINGKSRRCPTLSGGDPPIQALGWSLNTLGRKNGKRFYVGGMKDESFCAKY